jgi:hypothetical protein
MDLRFLASAAYVARLSPDLAERQDPDPAIVLVGMLAVADA